MVDMTLDAPKISYLMHFVGRSSQVTNCSNVPWIAYLGRDTVVILCELEQLFLQRYGGVVSTEHLCGESGHEAVQILVEGRRVEAVEEVVASLKNDWPLRE